MFEIKMEGGASVCKPLSWFKTNYNFSVTKVDGRSIELVLSWDVETMIFASHNWGPT